MANVLPFKARVRVIRALVDGNSLAATSRLTCVDKDVVMRLGVTVGFGCMKLHDRLVKDVHAEYIEVDECWSFVGRHERRKLRTDPRWFGDQYTFFAIDSDTKFVPAYLTGKRSLPTATHFMKDLRRRVRGVPQVSVDGWPHWDEALRRAFGHGNVHAGAIVKEYQTPRSGTVERHLSPPRVKSTKKAVIYGSPDQERISTAIAERLNMTTRMQQRRLTRLTNAYSKKKDNLVAAVGLHFFWYSFVRVHESLGTTPAVRAGVADHEWTLEELVREALKEMGVSTGEVPPKRPSHYKRKTHTDAARA